MIPTLNVVTSRLPSTGVLRDLRAAIDAAVIAKHRHKSFSYDILCAAGNGDHVLIMPALMCSHYITPLGSEIHSYRYLAKGQGKREMRRDSLVVYCLTAPNELLSCDPMDVLLGSGSSSSSS